MGKLAALSEAERRDVVLMLLGQDDPHHAARQDELAQAVERRRTSVAPSEPRSAHRASHKTRPGAAAAFANDS